MKLPIKGSGKVISDDDQKIVDSWGWITLKLSNKLTRTDYNWLDQKVVDGFGKITHYFGNNLKLSSRYNLDA